MTVGLCFVAWIALCVADQGRLNTVVNQPIIDYIADHVVVQFTVVDNLKYGDEYFEAKINLRNNGNETVGAGDWKIYFTSMLVIEPDYLTTGGEYIDQANQVVFKHVNGYLFTLGPTTMFPGLGPGKDIDIVYKEQFWSVARTDQCPNWYVCAPGTKCSVLLSTRGEALSFVSNFTKRDQYKRTKNDQYDPWTPATRYDRNMGLGAMPLDTTPVVPTLRNYRKISDSDINLTEGGPFVIVYEDSLLMTVAFRTQAMLQNLLSINTTVSEQVQTGKYISFRLGQIDNSLSQEAYNISMNVETASVTITGAGVAGAFRGAVTLVQLAMKTKVRGSIPECEIVDWPRFPFRGLHVDVARNFQPKDTIIKLLDVMAMYKLNKFHFHLTDDEGWRLEIPGLEELTRVGGRRCHDLEERECVMSTLGSGPDNSTSGSGYYTVEDYKDILRAAADRYIEVIPEVESPGHAHAAIKSMQARIDRLRDIGDESGANEYSLVEENDPSQYLSVQYYRDNAINPCMNSTYAFIQEVFTQIKEMHKLIQPLKVFHFGGDEVATGAWLNSTACRIFLERGDNLKRKFTHRVSQITKDVTLAGWEDGLMDDKNRPWNRSLLENDKVIAEAWQNIWEWGTAARAYNLANAGYQVVLAPVTHLYLDQPQEPDPEERGLYWGTRYTDTYKTFSFMPGHWYMNADLKRSGEPITLDEICHEDKSGCPPLDKPENIIGMMGATWSETMRTSSQLEYMVFPRLLAIAERAWHKADWEGKANRKAALLTDWTRFANTLGQWDLAMLDDMDVAYRVPPPGARQSNYKISTNVEFPGLKVQYKVTDSKTDWQTMDQSRTFKAGQEIKFRTATPDGSRFSREVALKVAAVKVNDAGMPLQTSTPMCLLLSIVTCVLVR